MTQLLGAERPAGAGAARPSAPPEWRVVAVLAGREARLLLRHPATRVGLGLTVLGTLLVWFEDDGAAAMFDPSSSFGFPVLLLAFSLIVGANLGAVRARRAGAAELVESLPAAPTARTTAHVLGALAGVPLAAAVLAVMVGLWQLRPGTIGQPPWFLVTVVLLIVAGGAVTGVLLARWLPHPMVGGAGVIAVVVLQSNFGHESDTYQWLHFLPQEYGSVFEVGPVGWHVVYLTALVLLGGVLAVARHGLSRPVATVLAVAVVAVVGTGWAQIRPAPAGAVAHQVARLERPAAHQVCERHAGVAYCAYPEYRGWISEWRAPVEGVLARLPAPERASVGDVRQRTTPTFALGGPVGEQLDPERAWPADGRVHPDGTSWYRAHELSLAYQVGARAVGLPTVPGSDLAACSAGGQARVLTALWLAGQATPETRRQLERRAAEVRKDGQPRLNALHVLNALPDWMSEYPDAGGDDRVPELASGGRGADVVAAAALLEQPADRVGRIVGAHWRALRDPATPAVEVFRLVGAAPPAGYADLAPVRPGVGQACD